MPVRTLREFHTPNDEVVIKEKDIDGSYYDISGRGWSIIGKIGYTDLCNLAQLIMEIRNAQPS